VIVQVTVSVSALPTATLMVFSANSFAVVDDAELNRADPVTVVPAVASLVKANAGDAICTELAEGNVTVPAVGGPP